MSDEQVVAEMGSCSNTNADTVSDDAGDAEVSAEEHGRTGLPAATPAFTPLPTKRKRGVEVGSAATAGSGGAYVRRRPEATQSRGIGMVARMPTITKVRSMLPGAAVCHCWQLPIFVLKWQTTRVLNPKR